MTSASTRARPRPKAVTLTDAAASRVREIMDASDGDIIGLKIGVKNGGCAGMEYTMDYAREAGPIDEVVSDKGVKILIDPKAVLFLLGTTMDYRESKLNSGFVFDNPNQVDACGCGESVSLKPAEAPADDGA